MIVRHGNDAVKIGEDALSDRPGGVGACGIADDDGAIANAEGVRVTDRENGIVLAGDVQNGKIGRGVIADHRGGQRFARIEGDADLGGVLDDVIVGGDMTVLTQEKSRAVAVRGFAVLAGDQNGCGRRALGNECGRETVVCQNAPRNAEHGHTKQEGEAKKKRNRGNGGPDQKHALLFGLAPLGCGRTFRSVPARGGLLDAFNSLLRKLLGRFFGLVKVFVRLGQMLIPVLGKRLGKKRSMLIHKQDSFLLGTLIPCGDWCPRCGADAKKAFAG